MSSRSRLPIVVVFMVSLMLSAHRAWGQTSQDGMVSRRLAEKIGLDRAWLAHVEADRARERIRSMTLNVCNDEDRRISVIEVEYGDRRAYFTERQSGSFGVPLGLEGARRQAEDLVETQKALGRPTTVNEFTVPDVTLYLQTTRGKLHAIDGEVGRTRWALQIGRPDRPSGPAAANDDHVAMVSGSTLYLVDAIEGKTLWQRRIQGIPTAGPAISDQWVFVPTLRGTIEAFPVNDPTEPSRIYSSAGRITSRPTVSRKTVSWPTDRDFLYVSPADRLEGRFRLEARQTIVAPSTRQPPDLLFAASIGGHVYAVNEASGNVLWRHSIGQSISQSPVPIAGSLYVVTDQFAMYSLTTDAGALQWQSGGIRQFLAASQERLYCLSSGGDVLMLDAETGNRLGAIAVPGLDLALVNYLTDRIYLGSSRGVIQCLHEANLVWPMQHVQEPEEDQEGPEPPPTEPESALPDALPDQDAFMDDPGADAFGDDFGFEATEEGAGEGATGDDDDPFGFGDDGLFD